MTYDPESEAARAIAELFSPLSLTMLHDTRLAPAWRISFVANFFTGPLYREVQERFGLSRAGFVILFSLSQQPGLVARDIGLITGLPKNSISRAVSELLAAGLVSRGRDASDKRAKPLLITPEGQVAVDRVLPLFESRQRAMFAPLTPAEAADFDRLIEKIIFGMPAWVEPD